ncbi:hypothetical protein HKCCE3408_04610 [Rhodobacterales bacterium HKCCE3408]|nr:hypothetical protein [Rhodobacterales bacterium HKCCE3408]
MSRPPSLVELVALTRLTLSAPRTGAAVVLREETGREGAWLLFAIALVLSIFGVELEFLALGVRNVALVYVAATQAGASLILLGAIHHVGRAFGGSGDFDGALKIVAWINFVFLFVQAVRIVVLLVLPPAEDVFMMLSFALFLWLLVNFTAELHGFRSLGRVFLGVILAAVGLIAVFNLLGSLFGISVMPAGA